MDTLNVTSAYEQGQLKSYPITTEKQAFNALEQSFQIARNRQSWLSPRSRIEILEKLATKIETNKEQYALQAAREGGKPLKDSRVEVGRAAEGVKAAIDSIKTLGGREIPMGITDGAANRWAVTHWEPRGVVLAISAFNHPFNLIVHQVVTAVAAGCPVLVKPARSTPMSCETIVSLLHECGLPKSYAQMLLCETEVTTKLVGDSRVSFMTFIGSARVGWMLRSKLASGATCALEHGGIAPVIVDETADLTDAVPLLVKAGFYHAGQVCVSVQRAYVHASKLSQFLESFKAQVEELKVGDPTEADTDVGPLIDPKEVNRVHAWVEAAVAAGGKLLCGGKKVSETCYAPTIVLDPPDDSKLSTEEVFGPVVAVYSYDDLDRAVARANAGEAFFQAAVFTKDLERALDLSRRLNGMAVMVNDHTAFRVDWMPFGGARESGLGLGGIHHTIRDMSLERMVVFRSPAAL